VQNLPVRDTLVADDLVCMHLLNPPSEGRSNAKILNISNDIIEILSPISVLPGALIQLRHNGTFLLGEARRCMAVGGTFQIDVDIQAAYRRVA